jgi:hypothetical protein
MGLYGNPQGGGGQTAGNAAVTGGAQAFGNAFANRLTKPS